MAIQSSTQRLQRRLNLIVTNWQKLIRSARDNYRPELHYMRGPGPKWHAKHRFAAKTRLEARLGI